MKSAKQVELSRHIVVILGALGVAIGAFGAHGLDSTLSTVGKEEIWNTALFYYWVHVLALFTVSFTAVAIPPVRIWTASILLFCGSLIAIALGGPSWLGAITPFGGVGFIIGWLTLLKRKNTDSPS